MNGYKKFGKFYFCLVLSLLLIVSTAFAQELPGDWKGYAHINGSIASDTSPVSAVIGTSWVANTTVGAVQANTGYYLIHVPGSSGNTVKFKVCGVNATLAEQSWSVGPHPNSTDPYVNLSITTLANGQACVYACGCTGGNCVHGYCRAASTYCGDSYCDSGETCTNCASDCGSCAAAAPSAAAEEVSGVVTKVEVTKTVTTASPTAPAVVSIPTDKASTLKVDEVKIEVKETVSNVQVTVKESSLPTGASVAITTTAGSTYKYIDITTNVASAKVEKAKIKFKVEKSWITANSIASATVALQRYADNKWNKLSTSKVSEDTTYIYYEAESTGLSTFAITGEKKAAVLQACPFDCCVGEVNYTDKACASGYECKNRACVATAPVCSCGSWSNVDCGISPCNQTEMKQTRSCTPSACDTESRCVADTSCVTKPSEKAIPTEWIIAIVILAIVLILAYKMGWLSRFR
ncbi:MAG: PGF-pre-PGF domain-containing protein [Thaumarchaeota archaeon]|nr:PGF-pre-PGF domain-containing protein [Nitrososphaerota archaeon]